jgi:hypothetical protein
MRNFAGHKVLRILRNPGGTCRNSYGCEQLYPPTQKVSISKVRPILSLKGNVVMQSQLNLPGWTPTHKPDQWETLDLRFLWCWLWMVQLLVFYCHVLWREHGTVWRYNPEEWHDCGYCLQFSIREWQLWCFLINSIWQARWTGIKTFPLETWRFTENVYLT